MARPAAARVVDLKRSGAWPLVVFAIASGRVRLDLELAGVKNLTGLGTAIRATDPAGFARAEAAGLALGWGQAWVDTVLDECLAVVKQACEVVGRFGPRVSLVLKADIRPGFSGELTGKVERLEAALNRGAAPIA